MTQQVHDITDLPQKKERSKIRKKIQTPVAIAVMTAGVLLLIDDQIKKRSKTRGKAEAVETTEA